MRKTDTDLKSCVCAPEEPVALTGGLVFLSVCRARPYALNAYFIMGNQSSSMFGNLNSDAVRKIERVIFTLSVTPWQ